ncbi:MAG: TRAP transporter substrate-binding protein [Lachnospiraceae bacterium]|nr:TRAP transporter substrate-binding protein [Lachnospiraceae bacterium]
MKKRFMALFLAAVMVCGSLAACGGDKKEETKAPETKKETKAETKAPAGEETKAPEAGETKAPEGGETQSAEGGVMEGTFDQKYTWSLATTYATGTPMVDAYNLFAERLSEYSGGAITLNVFPDSSLMGENDSFLAVKSGELEFCGFGPTCFYLYSEDYGYMLAPFLIESKEAYQRLYNSDLVEQAKKLWREEYNTRDVAGMAYRGFRNMSCNTPINGVDDLKGVKLRLNDNQLWSASWSTFGATPVPIALGELYTSIQNGAADASEGPWEQMKSINLEEVQDYIIETKHICESVGIWMAEDLYQSLPDNYKAVVDRAGKEAVEYLEEEAIKREADYKQQLIDGGCEFIEPDLSGFKTAAEDLWNEYFESTWTTSTLEEVQAIMAGE